MNGLDQSFFLKKFNRKSNTDPTNAGIARLMIHKRVEAERIPMEMASFMVWNFEK